MAIVNRLDLTWQLVHHRAFDEVFACARAICDSASILTLWSAGSAPRLIVALSFARDWTLRWGLVRDRCESVGVGIQRRSVECMFACLWLYFCLARALLSHVAAALMPPSLSLVLDGIIGCVVAGSDRTR